MFAMKKNGKLVAPIMMTKQGDDLKSLYVANKNYLSTLPLLPVEYQQVEYIESTGSQYINLGMYAYYPSKDAKVEIDFSYQKVVSDDFISGIWINASFAHIKATSDGFETEYYNSNRLNLGAFDTNRHKFEIDLTKDTDNILFDGEIKGTYSNYNIINSNMTLFCAMNENSTLYRGQGRIYGAKYTYKNKLVRNLIPCYRKSDNVIGLYDLVENKFYTNSGSGTFLKGENV